MRMIGVLGLAAVVAGSAPVHSAETRQRIRMKVALADGTNVRLTEVEGQTAEVKQAGANAFHLGLVPSYSKEIVSIRIVDLSGSKPKPVAKVSGPIGEEMEVWMAAHADGEPPSLRITPERVD